MPKLIRKQLDPYWAYHVKNDLIKDCSNKTIFHGLGWGEFAAKLLENEEVQKALYTIYTRISNEHEHKNLKRNNPKATYTVIIAALQHCAMHGIKNKNREDIFPEIYKFKDDANKLAKEIRKIKRSTKRLLNITQNPEDKKLYNYAIKEDEKDPKSKPSFPSLMTDEQIMTSLDILAGAFDTWDERFNKNFLWTEEFTGLAFRISKRRGQQKDWLECSFIQSMKRLFLDSLGDPLTPVIAVLRNAVYPEKKSIDARRIREILKEIQEDEGIKEVPAKDLII